MRIAIDARFYSEAGVGRYIKNLLYYLQKLDNKNEYFILLRKKDFEKVNFSAKNFQKILADIPWYGFAEQIELPKVLYSIKPDLVHFPHFNIPIFYKGKFVVTIHDLIHQKFKMKRATTHDPITYFIKHKAYNYTFATALKKSAKIITVSDYVEQELIEQWKADKNKIIVTKEGVEEKLIEQAKKIGKKEIDETLNKFNIKPPFIFYVGNAHPHKNVEGLIKAFLLLREKYQDLQLVLSGNGHYFWDRIKNEFLTSLIKPSPQPSPFEKGEGVKRDIIFTGYISDEELIALYKSTKVYIVPSFEEGFGIPLLEAMACGTPVASSNRASLPEVGDDAVIYFDPNDINDMSEKISEILNSPKLQNELKEKGEKQYKKFSWEKMTEQTLTLYQNVK